MKRDRKTGNRSKDYDPIDPSDPLVVRYRDQTNFGWARALAEIDRRIDRRKRRKELAART